MWQLRPDAPYKSELTGLWIVAAEQVQATVAAIRADYGRESIPLQSGPFSCSVEPCLHDPECAYEPSGLSSCAATTVLFVDDFAGGRVDLGGNDSYEDLVYDEDCELAAEGSPPTV